MKCSKCGQEFEGKFCPNCGTPVNAEEKQSQVSQPVAQEKPKKKKGCLTAALILIGIIIIIVIAAQSCGTGSSKPTAVSSVGSAASNGAASETASSEQTSSAQQTSFKVGETAKYNDVELTVTSFKTTKGGEYDSPKEGNEYAIVTVKYKNDGKENASYNPYDFKIKNSKGQITSQVYLSTLKDDLNSGDLAQGGEVEGAIAFEVPKDDKGLVLQYTGSIFDSNSEVDFALN
jgi:flagellar basal body-associated protein FliL